MMSLYNVDFSSNFQSQKYTNPGTI